MRLSVLIEHLSVILKEQGDMPVWLGIDSGEGWPRLTYLDSHSSFLCPLDGDEVQEEWLWDVEEEGYIPDPLYTEGDQLYGIPILILGSRESLQEIEAAEKQRQTHKTLKEVNKWIDKHIEDKEDVLYIVSKYADKIKSISYLKKGFVIEYDEFIFKNQEFKRLAKIYGFKIHNPYITYHGPILQTNSK